MPQFYSKKVFLNACYRTPSLTKLTTLQKVNLQPSAYIPIIKQNYLRCGLKLNKNFDIRVPVITIRIQICCWCFYGFIIILKPQVKALSKQTDLCLVL